jgi:transcriptional regulator with XRE-family HTH domain
VSDAFAPLLRAHRTHRRCSQEALALEAGVSTRHLSCLETGKARPSRAMVLQLARVLGLELRERNALLLSAGFAAVHPSTPIDAAAMAPISRAIDFLLAQHEPYPCILVDRCWNLLRLNDGARRLLGAFVDPGALPVGIAGNLVRLTLHPRGLRPHVVGWEQVAALMYERVQRAHQAHPADEGRRALFEEVRAYPDVASLRGPLPDGGAPVASVHLAKNDTELRLFTVLTSVGTPLDVTAEDLTVESLFPADEATERWFRLSASTEMASSV